MNFDYKWTLKDAVFTKDKGAVFSCFSCGGGSTMGYKLAGFDVIGCNEIDKQMFDIYTKNHNPKYGFLEQIQTFKNRDDLPKELCNLDILDGSPPCSSFSVAGRRDKDWGKSKKFREGQVNQVLDTLFFDFIDLAHKLQPKVVVAENVKGLLIGNARQYLQRIYEAFDKAGYYCNHYLLDSANMGVPQRRERVFFVCLRKDLASKFCDKTDLISKNPKINLEFNEKPITFGEVRSEIGRDYSHAKYGQLMQQAIESDVDIGDINVRLHGRNSGFNCVIWHDKRVCGTITSQGSAFRFFDKMHVSDYDFKVCGTFPQDYDFCSNTLNIVKYVVGMSVPPVMMARIATEIYNQWLSKL